MSNRMLNPFDNNLTKKITAGVCVIVTAVFFLFGPVQLSSTSVQPKKVHAQESLTSALGSGLGKGMIMCLGNLVVQFQIPQAIGKVAAASFINPIPGIPNIDIGSQISQGQQAFTKFIREGCLDAIAYFAAQSTLNKISQDTIDWVNSGFKRFGQPGNKAYVGDLEGFLSGVSDQSYNRFLREIETRKVGNPLSGVCEAFQPQIVRSLSKQYFSRNQQPAGVTLSTSTDIAAGVKGCENVVSSLSTSSVQSFVNGDFEEGGWQAFQHTLSNPNANPVGAFLQKNRQLKNRIQQASNIEAQKLRRNNGYVSAIACPNGKLNPQTQMCESEGKSTKPVVKTPGSVVNKQLNKVIGSGQRQLEMADEVNEIVGALVDQLIGKITGTGANASQGGVFSQAAQEASSAANLKSYAQSGGYQGLQVDYASSTFRKQITLEQNLKAAVSQLPSTNKIAKIKARTRNSLRNNGFDSPGQRKRAEGLLRAVNAVESNVFPPVKGTRESQNASKIAKEARENPNEPLSTSSGGAQIQKIDWVGNKKEWSYGEAEGLKKCKSFGDAYSVSFLPKRDSGRWEAFMCLPKNNSQFNEKNNQFSGRFKPVPDSLLAEFNMKERPLYQRASTTDKIKIDWNGANFDWKHYNPFAGDFSSWVPEDREHIDDQTYFRNIIFLGTKHIPSPGPEIKNGEAENMEKVTRPEGEENRYGTQVCDNRTLGDRSYIVRPHSTKWTIEQCILVKHKLELKEVKHYRFADLQKIQKMLEEIRNKEPENRAFDVTLRGEQQSEGVPELENDSSPLIQNYLNGTKPPAYRTPQRLVESFQGYINQINTLIGDTTYDNSYGPPTNEKDNLRELAHDLRTIDNAGGNVSNRKRQIDKRFATIKRRFHTKEDIKAATKALSELSLNQPQSTLSKLQKINKKFNSTLPPNWTPPVGGGGDSGGSGNGTSTTSQKLSISQFAASRTGPRDTLIEVNWSSNAVSCQAINNTNIDGWNSQKLKPSGSTFIQTSFDGSTQLTISCSDSDETNEVSTDISARSDTGSRTPGRKEGNS